jgi:hypothetical protein
MHIIFSDFWYETAPFDGDRKSLECSSRCLEFTELKRWRMICSLSVRPPEACTDPAFTSPGGR